MKASTKTLRVKATHQTLYDFIANIENLPKWATMFCLELKKQGTDYKVMTPGGEIFFRIDADPKTGIVDMLGGPAKDMMQRWPARVVSDNVGGAVFMFTAIQSPHDSDEAFAGQCAALDHEFENIRKAVEK